MIEETLMQYGVLGLWTISLLADRMIFQNKVKKALENNTKAITLFLEKI